MENLARMKGFTLVPRPPGRKVVKCRWHLRKKYVNGVFSKFKARLVARGFTQFEGVDFTDTVAPSSRQESLKAFLSFCAANGSNFEQLDVVAAFLYGLLEKDIYMTQPPGFVDPEHPTWVWHLNASLYSLNQSARQWHIRFVKKLQELGFTASNVDPSLHIKRREGTPVACIILHVDDILLSGSATELSVVKQHIRESFNVTSPESVTSFLSFEITQDAKNQTFTLNQSTYVNEVLELYRLEDAKSRYTPCDGRFKHLVKNANTDRVTNHPYCQPLGALQWLSIGTRFDISFAVNRLSQFGTSPTDEHWRAAVHLLLYVKGTIHFSLTLGGTDTCLNTWSDSDWAKSVDDRRSATGFLIKIDASVVIWQSRRQPTVALSSTEAEDMALTETSWSIIWWCTLLDELGMIDLTQPTVLHYKNKGSGELALNPCHHRRFKHIESKHHFMRECESNKVVKLKQVPTVQMLADMMTKPLGKVKHQEDLRLLSIALD